MPSYHNLTINLGANEEGDARDKAYRNAAANAGVTLSTWVRSVLDAEVHQNPPPKTPPNPKPN